MEASGLGGGQMARTGVTALLLSISLVFIQQAEVLWCSSFQPLTSLEVLGSDWSEDADQWLEVGGWGSGTWFHSWVLIVVGLNINTLPS